MCIRDRLGFVLGYIVGIVNDVKLNDGDNIVKKVLIRIVKVIFTVYVEVFRDTQMCIRDRHLESSMIEYKGQKAELTKNELKILYYLFKNSGKICSRNDIVCLLYTSPFVY